MRALIQRVSQASVSIEGRSHASIQNGLVIFLGIGGNDVSDDVRYLADRCATLRIFSDQDGKMNLSLKDVNGSALVVSQFTLYADTRKGNRPSFTAAAAPEIAERFYNEFISILSERLGSDKVSSGLFRAMMKVHLVNDGPVTIMLESNYHES